MRELFTVVMCVMISQKETKKGEEGLRESSTSATAKKREKNIINIKSLEVLQSMAAVTLSI